MNERVSISITDGIADVRMIRADKLNALDSRMCKARPGPDDADALLLESVEQAGLIGGYNQTEAVKSQMDKRQACFRDAP